MKKVLLITTALIIGSIKFCFGQTDISSSLENKIIITTPGYTSIYRYNEDNFDEGMKKDFRIQEAVVESRMTAGSDDPDNKEHLTLKIGNDTYDFMLCAESPVARLIYDRNKRSFMGVGFNFIENTNVKYKAPSFEGHSLCDLPNIWKKDIDRVITDKTLLSNDKPEVLILEADIDENGIIHKIVELNGALRQYSKIIIDKIYDAALRGWQPATKNGVPVRTYAQIKIELTK